MGIFVSYRREDSAYTLLVYRRLVREFGAGRIFRDRESIGPGENFPARIDDSIVHSQAMVAVVGKGWVARAPGLSQTGDFVRRELLLALEHNIPVLPLLVGGVQMPSSLPPDLEQFTLFNAIPVTDFGFDFAMDALVRALQPKLGLAPSRPPGPEVAAASLAQVDRLQIGAVHLIEQGDLAGAQRLLAEGWELLMDLQPPVPGPAFDLRFGFLCKTLTQAFQDAGDAAQADNYLGLAASAFTSVERLGDTGSISSGELAFAINGLGNVHSLRGESDEAIAAYRRAVAVAPFYAYAWHDLFLEYLNRANRGNFEPSAMREALSGLRRTGLVDPGPERIALFEAELARIEETNPSGSQASAS